MNNVLTQAAVTLLRNAEADGETMESIITELGLREQVVQRMQLMDVQLLARLVNPTAVVNAKTNTSITISDIDHLADAIASNIASNADEYIDHSNIELSIDYDRQVNVDSIGIEETRLSDTINEHLTEWFERRNITITAE